MAIRKRGCSSSSSTGSSMDMKRAKCQVQLSTFDKWKRELDREHDTMLWLYCDNDKADRLLVSTLWCKVCRDYETKIAGMRNYSCAWIEGSCNHRTSNIVDHAKSDQHKAAMNNMHKAMAKARNEPVCSYSAVAKALLTIDDAEKSRLMKKSDICYVLAREGIAFKKYPPFHALEQAHGIDLGSSYMWPDSASRFSHGWFHR